MKKTVLSMTAVGALTLLTACGAGAGNAPASAKPPVAHVDGKAVSAEALDLFVKARTGKPLAELSPEQQADALDGLITLTVAANAAEKQGLMRDPETAAELEMSRLEVLARAAVKKKFKDQKPSDTELKAEYDRIVGQMPKEELKVAHILVDDEAQAKALITQLEGGASFAELARKNSKDGSAAQGGEMDFTPPSSWVPEFAAAAQSLKDGEYTRTPVKSQFGYHVILRKAARALPPPPPFEQVKEQLAPAVEQNRVKTYIEELKKAAKIERAKAAAAPAAAAPTPNQVPQAAPSN